MPKDKLVRIKINTLKRLAKYGAFGESYDDVLNKVLNELKGDKLEDEEEYPIDEDEEDEDEDYEDDDEDEK